MVKADQFWADVAQAYEQVSADNSLELTTARGGKEAKLKAVSFDGADTAVVIIITLKPTETKQAFIVP